MYYFLVNIIAKFPTTTVLWSRIDMTSTDYHYDLTLIRAFRG